MEVIRVKNLRKVYKVPVSDAGILSTVRNLFHRKWVEKVALDDINFTIHAGEIVGYVGTNGAGKSTTLKILAGVLYPTSGYVFVNGMIPHKNRVANARNIAFIAGQRPSLLWDLPVKDSFELNRRIYQIDSDDYKKNLIFFSELLGIDEFMDIPVRQLSLGQRMRAGIAVALMHKPQLIYLDEPSIGMDVIAKERVRTFLREYNNQTNATIIITSHDTRDIEDLCSRLLIINRGKIKFDGTLEELRNKYINYDKVIVVKFKKEIDQLVLDMCDVSKRGDKYYIYVNTGRVSVEQVLSQIQELRHGIDDLSIEDPDLEMILKMIHNQHEQTS